MLQDGYTFSASQFVDVDNDRDPDLVLAGQGFYRLPGEIVSSDSQVLVNRWNGALLRPSRSSSRPDPGMTPPPGSTSAPPISISTGTRISR